MILTSRVKFTIIKVNTNEIVCTDLIYTDAQIMINLSAPSRCTIQIPQPEQFRSAAGITWKTWGYWIIPEIELSGVYKCFGAQLLSKVQVDPQSGQLILEGIGFMGYPKGIPWLENYNPIAVDPAEVVQKVWAHVQNYTNANLGVQVLPASTGTQMLPGYSFDGSSLNFDFFAMFVREVDFQDCGDVINSLARDLPLDMLEEVAWDAGRTAVTKTLRIGYPYLGYEQQGLGFVLGQNVITAEMADELEIEPVSDVIIRGWRPGKTYSSRLTNADPTRVRRVIMEEDASIDSTERAAAWAKRKLTRRNIPTSFSKITIDPNHPNAPLNTFWVGDSIYVEAASYPWVGTIEGWHRVTSMTIKANEPLIELGLKVEGAFNYDPILYDPNYEEQPTEDLNLLVNGYFSRNMSGWSTIHGQWFRVTQDGYSEPGCVRVDCDDYDSSVGYNTEYLESHKVSVNPGDIINLSAFVKRESITLQAGINVAEDGIFIMVKPYRLGALIGLPVEDGGAKKMGMLAHPEGTGPWTEVSGSYTVPLSGAVDQISVTLCVTKVASGITWWDDVRILKA